MAKIINLFPDISKSSSVRIVKDEVKMYEHTFSSIEYIINGIDDTIYEKNRDIWETIPRGNGVYFVDNIPVANITGLRKFGYSDSPYGYINSVNTVVLVDKENGECAHVGAFQYDNELYWIVGSKHVHVIFKVGDFVEAESVYTAERYRYAIKIARIWNIYSQTNPNITEFHNYLSTTGYTACGEAILSDSEHIVSYYTKDIIKFYAVMSSGLKSADGLTVITPLNAFEKFVSFGLPTAVFSPTYSFNSAEYVKVCEVVARRTNSEGVVAYGIDIYNNVCCMWKEKSYPYVMERVVREQITHNKTHTQICHRVIQRLKEHDDTIRAYFAEWETKRFPWLLTFAEWLRQKQIIPVKNTWDVQSKWLSLQTQFSNISSEERAYVEEITKTSATIKGPTVIQLVGLPGSGKSTVARALYWLLNNAGYIPRWLNQDEADSNRKKYLDAIKTAASDLSTTHIILDKSNLDPSNRKDYEDLGLNISLTVNYSHPDGYNAYMTACKERFMSRGACHRSLRATDVGEKQFKTICAMMFAKYVAPSGNVLNVNVCEPVASIVSLVSAALGIMEPECNRAVQFAQEYERSIGYCLTSKRPQFCSINPNSAIDVLLAAIPKKALVGKHIRKDFHITTCYFGEEMNPIWYMKHIDLVTNQMYVDFTITEIVWDKKAITARVKGEFECTNTNPHITLALAPKIKPAYSNDILESLDVEKVYVEIPMTGKYGFN